MKNYRKYLCLLLFVLTVLTVFPLVVSADTGPKPSVRVQFESMGDELCYATLLSEKKSAGPYAAWEEGNSYVSDFYFGDDVWQAFQNYAETDSYYFLQTAWQVNETKSLDWTYYPPRSFKILLYYPETETFLISGVYESYAFDSYFAVDMTNVNKNGTPHLVARRSYNYLGEVSALLARILITVAVELLVAVCFGLKGKKIYLLLLCTNGITQLALNFLLNYMNYSPSGRFTYLLLYILSEAFVFVFEAVLYGFYLNRQSEKKYSMAYGIAYALVANAASLAVGLALAAYMPTVF